MQEELIVYDLTSCDNINMHIIHTRPIKNGSRKWKNIKSLDKISIFVFNQSQQIFPFRNKIRKSKEPEDIEVLGSCLNLEDKERERMTNNNCNYVIIHKKICSSEGSRLLLFFND